MISSNAIAFKEISATYAEALEEPFLIGTARLSLTCAGAVAALPDFVINGAATLSLESSATVVATTRNVSGNALLATAIQMSVASSNAVEGSANLGFFANSLITAEKALAGKANISLDVSGSIASVRTINGESVLLTLTASGSVSAPVLITALANISLDAVAYLRSASIFDAAAVSTFLINTSTKGHAVYTNYPLSSYFVVGGKYFGTSLEGLVELAGQSTDVWVAKAALTDCGTPKLKAVPDCYLESRLDNEAYFELSSGESLVRSSYVVTGESGSGLRRRRVKTHKGLKATRWQSQLSGIGDAEVTKIELAINETQRSI